MSQKITSEILDAALAGEWSALRRVPKTDLHAHLLLCAPPSVYARLGGPGFPAPPRRFDNLGTFLQYLRDHYFPLFTSIDVYRTLLRESFDHMIADGIVYTEASFDMAMPLLLGISWGEMIELLSPELERIAGKLAVQPELGLSRDFIHPEVPRLLEEALATDFFYSVDLYGAETARPVAEFDDFFAAARAKGLKIKLHAGEIGAPERVREEIRRVQPHAIQHGVRASESAELMDEIAGLGIEVNVCPFSNWCLNVVSEYAAHPIRQLFDAGVRVTLNTDDLSIFGRSLSEEYAELYRAKVLSADELERIRAYGLSAIPEGIQRS